MAIHLEETLAAAVRTGRLPQAIVCATNRDGTFAYRHAIGLQNPGRDKTPVQDDALLMLASTSKLLTALTVLKAQEQGLVDLDADVAPHLPELAALPIFAGFDDGGQPILKPRTKTITLRQLLTHTSGVSYPFHAPVSEYQAHVGRAGPDVVLSGTIIERCDHPLVFEPGESWRYGHGLDWAGRCIERVAGVSLEEYMRTHLWAPLGVEDGITFWPSNPEFGDRVPQLSMRTVDGGLSPMTEESINTHSVDCFGGHGLYATMPAYLAVLRDLLNPTTSKLLSAASIAEFFRPQFGKSDKAVTDALTAFLRDHGAAALATTLDLTIPVNHGLGGILVMEDDVAEGRRMKGTMLWGGMTNVFWFVDREAGLAMAFGTQLVPPGDAGAREIVIAAERTVYQLADVQF